MSARPLWGLRRGSGYVAFDVGTNSHSCLPERPAGFNRWAFAFGGRASQAAAPPSPGVGRFPLWKSGSKAGVQPFFQDCLTVQWFSLPNGVASKARTMAKISDKALIQLILFAGAVSFFLGKKVLVTEGDELAALRAANRKAA